jgi:hypothetical protein
MTFSDLVETVKDLSIDQKEQLQMLLKQYLREERREEIYENFKLARKEEQKGELKYSADLNELMRFIDTINNPALTHQQSIGKIQEL